METVVVTIACEKKERDYELPCLVRLKELYPRILAVMREDNPGAFDGTRAIVFRRTDGFLCDPEATLADYGVQTGAKLELIREE